MCVVCGQYTSSLFVVVCVFVVSLFIVVCVFVCCSGHLARRAAIDRERLKDPTK